MKNLQFLLLVLFSIVVFQGCDQPATHQKDDRPQTELAFIKVLVDADSLYKVQHNDIGKTEVFDSSKKVISHFIADKLQGNIDGWPARVHSIKVDLDGSINLELMVSKGTQFDEKYPEYNSIILRSNIVDNNRIKDLLKPLSEGSNVIVSGTFLTDKDKEGNIAFDGYAVTADEEETLNNPAFNFNIADIKKLKHAATN